MNREEAQVLQVGRDKIFVVEPRLEEILELEVVKVELRSFSTPNSMIQVTGRCKAVTARTYKPSEICKTELDAMQKLADIHQTTSNQALAKRHHVLKKIAKLKSKRRV